MGHLRLKAKECGYKEKERKLMQQIINSISDEQMMTEIIRKLTAIKETNKVTSEQILC